MATKKEKQELIDVLKFTPIEVTMRIQGYGGECYSGRVDRETYEFFKKNKYSIDEYAGDWDGEWNKIIPDKHQPFPPGSPYECDGFFHASGAELSNLNHLEISNNETNETIWEIAPGLNELEDAGVIVNEWGGYDFDDLDDGTVVFWGGQGEKGCFFDAEFTLRAPFDPKKLTIRYENCDGWWIINGVEYDGEELDGSGGYSTTGKWAENKFVIVGDEEVFEAISAEDRDDLNPTADFECVQCSWKGTVDELDHEHGDDGVCPMCGQSVESIKQDEVPPMPELPKTEWYPKDIKPVRKGNYEVLIDAPWPSGGLAMAEWTGRTWKQDSTKVNITQWRGLTQDFS